MTSNICYSVSESPRRHSRAGFSVANIFQTPVWFREVRPDNDDSRRHASIPHPLRFTGIARRPTPLSSGRFCRAMRFGTAVELWFRRRREACYPHRSFSNWRYWTD